MSQNAWRVVEAINMLCLLRIIIRLIRIYHVAFGSDCVMSTQMTQNYITGPLFQNSQIVLGADPEGVGGVNSLQTPHEKEVISTN